VLPLPSFSRTARSCAHERIVLYCSGGERSQKALDFNRMERKIAKTAAYTSLSSQMPDIGQIVQGKKPEKSCLNSKNSSCNPLDICVK
jgi:hypothetical protein